MKAREVFHAKLSGSPLPHGQRIEVGPLLLFLLADLMDSALERLAQVQHFGVAGQDLGEHDEDVADVRVLARLQAVHGRLRGEADQMLRHVLSNYA